MFPGEKEGTFQKVKKENTDLKRVNGKSFRDVRGKK